jgi:hypothetical protein
MKWIKSMRHAVLKYVPLEERIKNSQLILDMCGDVDEEQYWMGVFIARQSEKVYIDKLKQEGIKIEADEPTIAYLQSIGISLK